MLEDFVLVLGHNMYIPPSTLTSVDFLISAVLLLLKSHNSLRNRKRTRDAFSQGPEPFSTLRSYPVQLYLCILFSIISTKPVEWHFCVMSEFKWKIKLCFIFMLKRENIDIHVYVHIIFCTQHSERYSDFLVKDEL